MDQSDKQSQRFAFIRSSWHADIVNRAYQGFLEEMARHEVPKEAIDSFEVPGAFEIPLQAKLLARTKRYAAIVASGLVVDGGIYRHEFVASTVIDALMSVQLETEVPVISAVLTPHHFHEHAQHQQFFGDHFLVKGAEAAIACVRMAKNLAQARELQVIP
ncbi:6,7-dimethyl-8-ribityllumazine synthase [Roseomonas rosea]|uniref:6,7-dimethyl-8-ribityllumazine synthase n=1 Tax=Muricoccus roseus TaxID=198092 RepID=A0A1M6RHS5_9PROT|nr:6,7-dimethyl-8-ribityllumazine synthase [Roseomonas rosea]SHK31907.1 6,7-dimethyl-8-ribityllumazine synthase [Roseomonas rosea]